MAEKEKKIGEAGEAKAKRFFERIGWTPIDNGIDIDCLHPEQHKRKEATGPREAHGVDLVFSYICPLVPNVRRNVLISVKDSMSEETKPRNSAVKNAIGDLDTALKCFKKSIERSRYQSQGGGATATEDVGVLVKINKDPNAEASFLDSLSKRSTLPIAGRDIIYYIENSRFDFIELAIQYVERKYQSWGSAFFYPKNSTVVSGEKRNISSSLLPVQNLSGGPLAFRLEKGEDTKLVIISQEKFSESRLRRYVGMALDLSTSWVAAEIVFPDFQNITHQPIVNGVLISLVDRSFARKLSCDTLNPLSRLG